MAAVMFIPSAFPLSFSGNASVRIAALLDKQERRLRLPELS